MTRNVTLWISVILGLSKQTALELLTQTYEFEAWIPHITLNW